MDGKSSTQSSNEGGGTWERRAEDRRTKSAPQTTLITLASVTQSIIWRSLLPPVVFFSKRSSYNVSFNCVKETEGSFNGMFWEQKPH